MRLAVKRILTFEWAFCPDGYRIERSEDKRSAVGPLYNNQIGGTDVVPWNDTLEGLTLEGNIKKPIACDLVNILHSPHDKLTAMCNFASDHGLLTCHREEDVSEFDRAIDKLRWAQHVHEFQGVMPELLKRKPINLLQFIWCEFVDVLEAGHQFRICAMCSDMFASAHVQGGRKEDRWFCRDKEKQCRRTWHHTKEGAARRAEYDAVRKEVQKLESEALRQQGSPGKGGN